MNMKKTAVILLILAGLSGAGFYAWNFFHHVSPSSVSSAKKVLYHCPMHPTYISDRPGNCPICGMTLVLMEDAPEASAPVPGRVNMTPQRRQLIGVKTEKAARVGLKKVVRASARVAYDAELYNAIAEYREALAAKEKVRQSPLKDTQESADALIRAAAFKLRQMGFSQEQMNELRKRGGSQTNLLLGERGGSVWVYAQIYEFESGLVKPGQTLEATTSSLPGKTFTGAVKSVDPILSAESRSLRVRAEVPNPEGLLKPEMYVDAKIIVELGNKLAVPEEAVMDTGERKIAFVETGPGTFEPRDVVTGQEAEGYVEILSGVKEGETVVTSANFLIDSESRLKSALSDAGHKHGAP